MLMPIKLTLCQANNKNNPSAFKNFFWLGDRLFHQVFSLFIASPVEKLGSPRFRERNGTSLPKNLINLNYPIDMQIISQEVYWYMRKSLEIGILKFNQRCLIFLD